MKIKSICKRIIRQFQEKRIVYVEKVEKPYVIQLLEANRFKDQVAIVYAPRARLTHKGMND